MPTGQAGVASQNEIVMHHVATQTSPPSSSIALGITSKCMPKPSSNSFRWGLAEASMSLIFMMAWYTIIF